MDASPALTLYPGKVKWSLLLVLWATVTGVAIWDTDEAWFAWPMALGGSAAIVWSVLQLAGHGGFLILAADRFTLRTFTGTKSHEWIDVAAVELIKDPEYTTYVLLRLRDGDRLRINPDFGMSASELASTFRRRAAAWKTAP